MFINDDNDSLINLRLLVSYINGLLIVKDNKIIEIDNSYRLTSKIYNKEEIKNINNIITKSFNNYFNQLSFNNLDTIKQNIINNNENENEEINIDLISLKEEINNHLIFLEQSNNGLVRLYKYYRDYWNGEYDNSIYDLHIYNCKKIDNIKMILSNDTFFEYMNVIDNDYEKEENQEWDEDEEYNIKMKISNSIKETINNSLNSEDIIFCKSTTDEEDTNDTSGLYLDNNSNNSRNNSHKFEILYNDDDENKLNPNGSIFNILNNKDEMRGNKITKQDNLDNSLHYYFNTNLLRNSDDETNENINNSCQDIVIEEEPYYLNRIGVSKRLKCIDGYNNMRCRKSASLNDIYKYHNHPNIYDNICNKEEDIQNYYNDYNDYNTYSYNYSYSYYDDCQKNKCTDNFCNIVSKIKYGILNCYDFIRGNIYNIYIDIYKYRTNRHERYFNNDYEYNNIFSK